MDNEPQNGQPPERQIDPICQPQQNMAESPAAQNYQVVEQPKQKIKIWKIILSIALPLFVCASVVFVLTATSKKTDDVVKLDTSKAADAAKLDTSKATDAGIQYVADANNQFAFELYNEIAKSEKSNIFYSPYSVSSALSMVYEGAKVDTASEIKSVFHFPASDVLRNNFAAIYSGLNQQNDNYEIKTGNALWVQNGYPLLPGYVDAIGKFYGGKIANLDFKNDTEASRKIINGYISQQTNDKITDLIGSGALGGSTKLVLTNAIYFLGNWEKQFDKSFTHKADFNINPNDKVSADMMYEYDESLKYLDIDNMQILRLPYKGDQLSMLIMLPKKDLDSISSNLTSDKLKEYTSKMSDTQMDSIVIPKFELNSKYDLNGLLSARGISKAFSDQDANFTGIVDQDYLSKNNTNLYISSILHQAFIKIDEKGTEATAATAVMMTGATSVVEEKPRNDFIADHPFVFLIQENKTGNILFMGNVTDPTK